jgi:hypothetical protein
VERKSRRILIALAAVDGAFSVGYSVVPVKGALIQAQCKTMVISRNKGVYANSEIMYSRATDATRSGFFEQQDYLSFANCSLKETKAIGPCLSVFNVSITQIAFAQNGL